MHLLRRARLIVAPAAALALAGAAAFAQSGGVEMPGFRADPEAPVEVSADSLTLDQTAGTAAFVGQVVITQGEMRLTAPQIMVEYSRNADGTLGSDVQRITASGGVMLVTPTEAAEAELAVYQPATGLVVMTGDVILTQGPNTLAGQRLTVDLTTGTGQVDGRVRTLLQPGGAGSGSEQ